MNAEVANIKSCVHFHAVVTLHRYKTKYKVAVKNPSLVGNLEFSARPDESLINSTE